MHKTEYQSLKKKIDILELRFEILALGDKKDYEDGEFYEHLKEKLERELEEMIMN